MSGDDYHRRTVVTRIDVTPSQEQLLEETVDEWRRGCQIAVDEGLNGAPAKTKLQQRCYDDIRDQTNLGSQHAILATHRATEALRSCAERRENGKRVSKPEFTAPTVTYDDRTMTLFDDGSVSLSTTESRVRCDLVLPDHEDGYQHQYLDGEWESTESTLHYRDDGGFLHLGFRRPKSRDGDSTAENGTVLGVDLGVNQIAVTSTAKFFDAGELNHQCREYRRRRQNLQRKSSRSVTRTLRSLAGKERRFLKHALHEVANGIVDEALTYDCEGIVLEELDGIREQIPDADWHTMWAFRRLREYVTYKEEAEGLFVETVSPENTSRRCPECGYTSEKNRPEIESFDCRNCSYRGHADYTAAKNIAAAYLRRDPQSSRRRGVSRYALKSGTVTPNRGFTSYAAEASEAESTDRPRS